MTDGTGITEREDLPDEEVTEGPPPLTEAQQRLLLHRLSDPALRLVTHSTEGAHRVGVGRLIDELSVQAARGVSHSIDDELSRLEDYKRRIILIKDAIREAVR